MRNFGQGRDFSLGLAVLSLRISELNIGACNFYVWAGKPSLCYEI
jgi:hypothetical protein